MIQDWRGRSVEVMYFRPFLFEIESDMSAVEALLLHVLGDPNKVKVKVLSAFFPLCLIKELIKAALHTNTDKRTIEFIG